jgi:hypothetical protein
MIKELEQLALLQLNASKALKPIGIASALHRGCTVEVRARALSTGRELLGYSYGGIRLERTVLLQLLSFDTTCPHCQQTQANWNSFCGISKEKPKAKQPSLQFRHLVEEKVIQAAGRTCIARPASFQCKTRCPVDVHAPAVVKKHGWDLFEGGLYVAGGLVSDTETRNQAPALPNLEAATKWLTSTAFETH